VRPVIHSWSRAFHAVGADAHSMIAARIIAVPIWSIIAGLDILTI